MTPEQRTTRNRAIAELCGWHVVGTYPANIARWESDDVKISAETFVAWMRECGLSVMAQTGPISRS